jgi:hypothetical protein
MNRSSYPRSSPKRVGSEDGPLRQDHKCCQCGNAEVAQNISMESRVSDESCNACFRAEHQIGRTLSFGVSPKIARMAFLCRVSLKSTHPQSSLPR